MHACNTLTLDQLVSLRDGDPVAADAVTHVEDCSRCSQELARLRAVQASLKSLPLLAAPEYNNAGMRARLRAVRTYRIANVAAAAGIGAITLLLITTVHGSRSRIEGAAASSPSVVTASNPAADSQADSVVDPDIDHSSEPVAQQVNSLVIRSQELDSRLRRMPRRPYIERAGTSATIDTLQDSIQWVDYQISVASDVGMTDSQSARLWENRIQLMDSLVKVRYAEAQRAAVVLTGSK
jgi:hypothetical protein